MECLYMMTLITIYTPEGNRSKQKRNNFYNKLQHIYETLRQDQFLGILMLVMLFNESIRNNNAEFFDHQCQHKYTIQNTREKRQ